MRLKGAQRFNKLIELNGGMAGPEWVAEQLNISPAAVKKRVQQNKLLAIKTASGLRFPVFQISAETHKVEKAVTDLLEIGPNWSTERIIRVLLSQIHPPENSDTPLQKVRQQDWGYDDLKRYVDRELTL